jgi:hypothetical protein
MGELVDRFVAACRGLEEGDVSKMEALFADEIEFVTPERTMHGREEAISRFQANQGAFSGMKLNIDLENGVIDAGDRAAVEFLITGYFTGSLDQSISITDGESPDAIAGGGQAFQMRSTDHIWWDGQKITRFHVFYDPAEPLRYLRGELQVAESSA